jgi:two-component system LytT family response regulator
MISSIIVDDEEKSRITLKRLIDMHCKDVQVLELCDSVNAAIKAIDKHQPQVVFLDVEMPFDDGFTLLEKIKDPTFKVIFTTAYDHYAIKAIKYSAMDYLLKPIDGEELKSAIEKLETLTEKPGDKLKQFENLLYNIKSKSAIIAIPTFEGLQMVNADDIIKCTADDTYTDISFVGGKRLTVSKLLKEFEELLEDYNFFRVHNSSLVNLKHVTKYVKGDGGYVVMSDGESCEVSRRKKNELLTKLTLVQV